MTEPPTLTGEKVFLRPLDEEDLTPTYLSWLNDPEVNRYLETRHTKQTMESLRNYFQNMDGAPDQQLFGIFRLEDGRHVGNIKLGCISESNRSAELGILIGDPNARGEGLGTDAIRVLLEYAFRDRHIHRVSLGVHKSNEAAIHVYQKVGFRNEGTLRQSAWMVDRFEDSYIMAVLAPDYLEEAS